MAQFEWWSENRRQRMANAERQADKFPEVAISGGICNEHMTYRCEPCRKIRRQLVLEWGSHRAHPVERANENAGCAQCPLPPEHDVHSDDPRYARPAATLESQKFERRLQDKLAKRTRGGRQKFHDPNDIQNPG